ncbi:uncharacterized protein LOC108906010 isoform X1 [Anoplophora glabripennis]|uniref:uncharacterized protein LOC108906010 isoform X1 n=1 Tax=Anoplophora glabripennis TaxID=217634 RepID=UPI0008752BA5|nr:uncharacterized protein LOC108906010 isoform X1 [Anoplophora glabripennis]
MSLKTATIVCLFALAQSATIQQRNIPVEVKYDETAKVTSLDEKIQTELADSASEVASVEQKNDGVRNLDEKIQLSPEDLTQASKHLPVVEEISLKNLEEVARSEEVTPAPTSLQSVLQQAEEVIYSGLKKLRNSFKAEKDQQAPNSEQWDDFEKSVNKYLDDEKTKLQLKQEQPPQNQNIFQNIAQGFQTVANNFVQNLVGNQNATNLGDEQQGGQAQGPFQGFVSFFQNGVGNVVNTINGLGNQGATTTNVNLSDTGTATTQAPNLVSNLVSNVQQFFGQIQGAVQGSGGSSGTQGDTGVNSTSSSSPQRPGQIIQSIGTAINQFIQGRPPNSSGDEGTGTTEGNVGIIQSIGNVIQNSPLNPFRPPQKPAEGGATTSNPIQAGISSAQNIGNQIGSQVQQLIPGQASSTEAAKTQEAEKVQTEQVEQSTQTAEVASNEVAPQKAKGFNLEAVENELEKKEELTPEEVKGEEVKQQMEEQVKQEEIKEEIRQEEMKEKVEEKNEMAEKKEEIMVTAE